ncbi:MAG: hypothetical protein IKJ65_03005 [Clostridia bacterium]|nr:hypothetical protein [Clostridia bacterium]
MTRTEANSLPLEGRWIGEAETDEVALGIDLCPANIKFVTGTPHQSATLTASPPQGKPFGRDVHLLYKTIYGILPFSGCFFTETGPLFILIHAYACFFTHIMYNIVGKE